MCLVVQIGVACLLIAGNGRDEQRALRRKAARKVQELKLASLVHGGGWQELGEDWEVMSLFRNYSELFGTVQHISGSSGLAYTDHQAPFY